MRREMLDDAGSQVRRAAGGEIPVRETVFQSPALLRFDVR